MAPPDSPPLPQFCWLCGRLVGVTVRPDLDDPELVRVTGCDCAPAFLATRRFWVKASDLTAVECDALTAAIRRAAETNPLPHVDIASRPAKGVDAQPVGPWDPRPPAGPWVVTPLGSDAQWVGPFGPRPWWSL